MCGKKSFPSIAEIDKKLNAILARYDMQNLQNISLTEFQSLISKDTDILQLLKGYNFVLSDDLREVMEDEKAIVQCDSDLDEEIEIKTKIEKNKLEISRFSSVVDRETLDQRVKKVEEYKKDFSNDNFKPSFFTTITEEKRSPEVNVEPIHVFGFRGFDMRNNIKTTPTGELVFFSGKSAVVYNKKVTSAPTQKIFQYHNQEISCIAVYESYVATGEFGEDPVIHVWDSKTLQVKFSLQGILKKGISHLRFSHDGKKLAAIELGSNHTVVLYDFAKLQAGKATEYKDQVLGVYKGPDKVTSNNQEHF